MIQRTPPPNSSLVIKVPYTTLEAPSLSLGANLLIVPIQIVLPQTILRASHTTLKASSLGLGAKITIPPNPILVITETRTPKP